jgi:hypothetical protein
MISVPIRIHPGLPEGLQQLERQTIDDQHRTAVLLSPYRQALVAVRDLGKAFAEEMIPMLKRDAVGQASVDPRKTARLRHFGNFSARLKLRWELRGDRRKNDSHCSLRLPDERFEQANR